MTAIDPFRHDDAAYVLGALDDADRAAFEAHLLTCADCRARVEELRPTADLLTGVPLSALTNDDPAPPMPDTLLPGLLRRARHERRRRGVVIAAVTAVAAACVAAVAIVVTSGESGSSKPAPRAFAAVTQSPVTATARLVAERWGTEIDLRCHYPQGVATYTPYALVVIDKEHHRYVGGSWTLVPGKTISFTGGTSVPRGDIDRVQITRSDGTPILELDV
ncbi:MAG: anti-sigma factor [Jatrophihabitans sp.]|uniref:anti-sigma factor family protein n=1 Tax=Jatrophihabitans sp. TaxID=1932789 RepID=UPI00391045FF